MSESKLKGLIYLKYKSAKEFADAIGWGTNKTSRIMSGQQDIKLQEVKDIKAPFELSNDEIIEIFLQ